MVRILLAAILLTTTALSLHAQDYVVLEKMGTRTRYEYRPGDFLNFQIHGERIFRKQEIVLLSDSSIHFHGGIVPISEIARIKTPTEAWMAASGGTLIVAGVGYFAIDAFNQSVIAGNNYSVDDSVLTTSLVLAGVGSAMVLLSSKKVKLKNNWRLRMVEIY